MTEQQRFLSLYQHQLQQTVDFTTGLGREDFTAVPIDNEYMFMGKRINRINIGSVLRHLIVAEAHWFNRLATVEEGGTIAPPSNASIVADIPNDSALIEKMKEVGARGMRTVADFDRKRLDTAFAFYGLQWTVQGFLWMIYSHQGFHKGQIDLILRQLGRMPIEYLDFASPPTSLLG